MIKHLIVMVGLPASGKSSYAKELKSKFDAMNIKTEILSSDKIREEHTNQEHTREEHQKVFAIMEENANKLLNNSEVFNVIYDATNLNKQKRERLIAKMTQNFVIKSCFYMDENLEDCIEADRSREGNHSVGEKVIRRMHRHMDIPSIEEGFDNITYVSKNNGVWECTFKNFSE